MPQWSGPFTNLPQKLKLLDVNSVCRMGWRFPQFLQHRPLNRHCSIYIFTIWGPSFDCISSLWQTAYMKETNKGVLGLEYKYSTCWGKSRVLLLFFPFSSLPLQPPAHARISGTGHLILKFRTVKGSGAMWTSFPAAQNSSVSLYSFGFMDTWLSPVTKSHDFFFLFSKCSDIQTLYYKLRVLILPLPPVSRFSLMTFLMCLFLLHQTSLAASPGISCHSFLFLSPLVSVHMPSRALYFWAKFCLFPYFSKCWPCVRTRSLEQMADVEEPGHIVSQRL